MKLSVRKIVLFVVALGVLAALVVVSGIVPIKASSGHWAITRWFLNFSMGRSVSTYSLGVPEPPSLDDPAMVLKGAGHYEIGCRACHGSPAMPRPRIAQQMTPKPPYLPPEIAKWDAKELFYIVKHGVKFTGMPAWPSQQRDDEVWAMVAFLRKLPDLSSEEYGRLVRGETETAVPMQKMLASAAIPAVTRSCMPCHGIDGLGRGTGAFPVLAGQRTEYLQNSLVAYARGERYSGIMEPIAASLAPDEVEQLSRYYSELAAAGRAALGEADAASIERGRLIAERGIPGQRVASCIDCHGPKGSRQKEAYPKLARQYANYLVLQLELFKKRRRGGSPYEHLMHPVADRLKPEQMRDVARYFESLPPEQSAPPQSSSGSAAPSTEEAGRRLP